MLLRNDYIEALINYQEFQNEINGFKSLVEKLDLPFITDYKVIVDKFKMNLFNQLMDVDAGLKYEYTNLLKTDLAKKQKVDSKINLDGYQETMQIKMYLQKLKMHEDKFNLEFYGRQRLYLKDLFESKNGNLEDYLKEYIIDFKGYEKDVKLINEYVNILNKVISYARDNGMNTNNLMDVGLLFARVLKVETNGLGIHKVLVNEQDLYNFLEYAKVMKEDI